MKGKIVKISGPLVVAEGMANVKMYDVVRVSKHKLIGEIIELRGDKASIQVYEDTSMIGPGEEVVSLQMPLSAELGPGLLGGIFDGIGRPLDELLKQYGNRIGRGAQIQSLDRKKKWDFVPTKKIGDTVVAGDVIGVVQETEVVKHYIMIPFGTSGKITDIKKGEFAIEDIIAVVKDNNGNKSDICMLQHWAVRKGRQYAEKIAPDELMVTGQRVIDTLFPIAKGGVAAVPGPFGSGKTVVQHQIAKWADADIVVYIGCGERGNEITDVLNEFTQLIDPKTGASLMKRTVLIANTSDMPVAAREASIYTGITIAEYFRDMGYSVAVMADSTSRWAEALREMGGRLEEMPGDEGYPAYLSSRLAEFYERAGKVKLLGSEQKTGAVTVIGAVSPPGGDVFEPVTQATLRIVKVFWGLSASLAYKRHFPAIDWLTSYSLYDDRLKKWFDKNVAEEYNVLRALVAQILHEEAKLNEIVKLIGMDALSSADRLIMDTAKSIREDYLHQNAFHETDSYTSPIKQFRMLGLIIEYYKLGQKAIGDGVDFEEILKIETRNKIGRAKYITENNSKEFDEILRELREQFLLLSENLG
ncbi:MAG: V-type ATP synthase subunit A [Firmicutes bacterium]|nr:V-type ATP synthase subunit A [Bacillota bacterium]